MEIMNEKVLQIRRIKHKRKIDKEILIKYFLIFLLNVFLIFFAYSKRGYKSIGGEVLILPLIFLVRFLFIEFKDLSKEIKNEHIR